MGVDDLLAEARASLQRLTPAQAASAASAGALLIDIRADHQRERDGLIPGAHVVSRNVLEWRRDPRCEHRDPALAQPEALVVIVCDEGYQSSLAAAIVQRLGIPRATDLIGGFQAWRAAGLPVMLDE
jgi:rhodanese-related sulfurtransferase